MSRRAIKCPAWIPILAAMILAVAAPRGFGDSDQTIPATPDKAARDVGKFTFVRIEYDSTGGMDEAYYYYDGRLWQRWQTDYPEADENFLLRLSQLTTIDVNPKPITMRLTDPRLFQYPFIYMSDVGWQELSPREEERLREYLLRGGFLWIDDFWGDAEWNNWEYNMRQVFPDLEWREIPHDHPILNIVFPLGECPQIPARDFAFQRPGVNWDPPFIHRGRSNDENQVNQVHFRGLFSKSGRLMAVATHNTDIGDGWEREAEDERYFRVYSVRAYALGINVISYIMSH